MNINRLVKIITRKKQEHQKLEGQLELIEENLKKLIGEDLVDSKIQHLQSEINNLEKENKKQLSLFNEKYGSRINEFTS